MLLTWTKHRPTPADRYTLPTSNKRQTSVCDVGLVTLDDISLASVTKNVFIPIQIKVEAYN